MREYEVVMILSPETSESEAAETVARITDFIDEGPGSVSHQENWGVRRLAYPIQRFIEGNYFITRCSMEAQTAVALDKTLNAAQDVLRHLVFRLEASEIAAMEKQAEREREAQAQAERRAAAEREARARDEARRIAAAQLAAASLPSSSIRPPTVPAPPRTQS